MYEHGVCVCNVPLCEGDSRRAKREAGGRARAMSRTGARASNVSAGPTPRLALRAGLSPSVRGTLRGTFDPRLKLRECAQHFRV